MIRYLCPVGIRITDFDRKIKGIVWRRQAKLRFDSCRDSRKYA